MSTLFLDRIPREISFTYRDAQIHPREVFINLYEGLERVVEVSRRKYFGRSVAREGMRLRPEKGVDELYAEWIDTPTEITAEIVFNDNTKSSFSVEKRTNFKKERLLKFPSIAYLQDHKGNMLILREARAYSLDDLILPFVKRRAQGIKFDLERTRQFYDNVQSSLVTPADSRKMMYLPEPHLLAALEKVYAEAPHLHRLTPRVATVASSEDKLWYLRDYYSQVVPDTPVDLDALGNYFGTLHALGLMEFIDRQMIHYGFRMDGLQNYDPDFMLHSQSSSFLEGSDWEDLKKELAETNDSFTQRKTQRGLKDRMNRVQERLARELGISRTTLFSHLSGTITTDHLSTVELRQ